MDWLKKMQKLTTALGLNISELVFGVFSLGAGRECYFLVSLANKQSGRSSYGLFSIFMRTNFSLSDRKDTRRPLLSHLRVSHGHCSLRGQGDQTGIHASSSFLTELIPFLLFSVCPRLPWWFRSFILISTLDQSSRGSASPLALSLFLSNPSRWDYCDCLYLRFIIFL